jgi:SAM-dependent methyltransferase
MDRVQFTAEFWDERYRSRDQLWSGQPNQRLVEEVTPLAPRRALDIGCGEGGDAIWLASQGWTVTGADVSPVALERAAMHAAQAGPEIAGQITWRQADLFIDQPFSLGEFDLVTSLYLHMPPEVRERTIARLTAAVARGGALLMVSHHPSDLRFPDLRPLPPELFYTAEELAESLDPGAWEIVTAAAPTRTAGGPDGDPVTVRDTVLHARRRGGASASRRLA